MSNAQRRSAERDRNRSFSGPHTEIKTARERRDRTTRDQLMGIAATRTRLLAEQERDERAAGRSIPLGGPGRRRAKAWVRRRAVEFSAYALEHPWAVIDPNQRVRNNLGWCALEDIDGYDLPADAPAAPAAGTPLVVWEPESALAWKATVSHSAPGVGDPEKLFVYLTVDWTEAHRVNPALRTGALTAQRRTRALLRALAALPGQAQALADGLADVADGIDRMVHTLAGAHGAAT